MLMVCLLSVCYNPTEVSSINQSVSSQLAMNESRLFSLTHGDGVVDAEAAKNSVDVPGVKESVPSDHHLEGFCVIEVNGER